MKLNKYIDHTLLKQDQTIDEFNKLIEEAKEYNFRTVCVSQDKVATAAKLLSGSESEVCTVIGFPLGNNTTEVKVFEATNAIDNGADEVDMVVNVSKVKDADYDYVYNDIKAINDAVTSKGKILKVIFETCLLTDDEIRKVSEVCVKAGVAFVKTSTGFSTAGANEHVVTVMAEVVKGKCEIKASGGVRTTEDAKKMIALGVTRIGTSNGIAIMNGTESDKDY